MEFENNTCGCTKNELDKSWDCVLLHNKISCECVYDACINSNREFFESLKSSPEICDLDMTMTFMESTMTRCSGKCIGSCIEFSSANTMNKKQTVFYCRVPANDHKNHSVEQFDPSADCGIYADDKIKCKTPAFHCWWDDYESVQGGYAELKSITGDQVKDELLRWFRFRTEDKME